MSLTLDTTNNFAKTTIDPIASGATSVVLASATKFPDPASGEYNCVIWEISSYGNPADDPNVEIVRMTAKSGSTYTITRAQESTSDSNHNTGGATYAIANVLTAKMITDIENLLDNLAPNTVKFNTNPTVGSFLEGKMYYDKDWRTISVNIDTDVNLQIGQEDLRLVYNNTGSTILNGKAVYTNGVYVSTFPYVATVALAIANDSEKVNVLGLATQDIETGHYGLVTVRGHVNSIDTSGLTQGSTLYLSDSVAGDVTTALPTAGNYKARIGRCIYQHATDGTLNVRIFKPYKLGDLSDVVISTPVIGDTVRWNGTEWVNSPLGLVSASSGVNFYNASPTIIATGTENSTPLLTLSKVPVTTAEQTVTSPAYQNSTVLSSAWLYNTALGRTSIDAGLWKFSMYLAVSSVAGGRTSTLTRQIYSVLTQDGGSVTVSITGSGTSRTATASGGTPFATTKIDASATNTTASYLLTPKGLYQITARTSDTEVTISTPTGYNNESTVAFSVFKKLLGATSSVVTNTGTNYGLYEFSITQPAFTITALHKLGMLTFCTGVGGASTTTMTSTYDGTARNSVMTSPLITLHNDLVGIQGSSDGVHVSTAQATVIGNTSGVNTGDEPSASTTVEGVVELAIASEVDTGTSATLGVTPDALAGSIHGLKEFQLKIFDDATAVTTGDGKIVFVIPESCNGMNLVKVASMVSTVSSSGTPEVQIRNVTDTVDMLSTKLTIDANEFTSYTAATPAVIDTTKDDVVTGDRLAIDVDTAGTGTKGLTVYLAFQIP